MDATMIARLRGSELFREYSEAFEAVTGRSVGLLECGTVSAAAGTPVSSGDANVAVKAGARVVGYLRVGPELFSGSKADPRQASVVRLLTIFSAHLATVGNQLLIGAATAESPLVARGRAFIAEHQGERIYLRDVARSVNLNAFYFCKVFSRETGLTFTEYLARVRVESVKRSLLNRQIRVTEAAFASGFQSLSQFNRVFLRIAGESPSCYRDRLHGLPPRRVAASLDSRANHRSSAS